MHFENSTTTNLHVVPAPHTHFVFDLVALLAVVTFVAFQRYRVSFGGTLCLCRARLDRGRPLCPGCEPARGNVVLGCIVGMVFVLAVHAIDASQRKPQR